MANIVLIDSSPVAFHNVAAARAVVQGGAYARSLLAPLHKVVPDMGLWSPDATTGHRLLIGSVTSMDAHSVTVQQAEGGTVTVEFDAALIATGSRYVAPARAPPGPPSAVVAYYDALATKVKASKNILVVGGGPVGIELCGELAETLPDATITLAHRQPRLLTGKWSQTKVAGVGDGAAAGAARRLEALGVKLALSTSVELPPKGPSGDVEGGRAAADEDAAGGKDAASTESGDGKDGEEVSAAEIGEGKGTAAGVSATEAAIVEGAAEAAQAADQAPFGEGVWVPPGGTVSTSAGDTQADLVFFCTGARPNTEWFAAAHPDLVDGEGFVKVDGHMRVQGWPNVFAAGDCAGTGDQKLLYRAGEQVKGVIGPNLTTVLNGLEAGKPAEGVEGDLKTLSVNAAATVLTFGSRSAMAQFTDSFGLCDCCAVQIKAGDLFRKEFAESTGASAVDGEDYRDAAPGWDLAPVSQAK